jgi:hypothetical protein
LVSVAEVPVLPPPGPVTPPPIELSPEALAQLKLDYELNLLALRPLKETIDIRGARIDELVAANAAMAAERPTATPARQGIIDITTRMNQEEILANQVAIYMLASEYQSIYNEAIQQYNVLHAFLPPEQLIGLGVADPLVLPNYYLPPPGTII